MVVFPALAVMTAVLSFNLLGDAWRDWLDQELVPKCRTEVFYLQECSAKRKVGMRQVLTS